MTELELMTEGIFKAVNDYVGRRLGPLVARVAELEARPLAKDGERGLPGEKGERGKDGEKGEMGMAVKGDKGDAGDSVDLEALQSEIDCAITLKLEKAITELPRPKDGERGEKGDIGDKGEPGKDYDHELMLKRIEETTRAMVDSTVAAFPKPKDGINGKDGKDAEPAEKGDRGDDGLNGRDALEIEPLSSIDFARAYARRTYALHDGGTWICRRSQPGKESWECVFDGINLDATELELADDERTVKIKFFSASGKQIEKSITFPVQINRGTWIPGAYKRGDVTTRHGSSWHAMRDTEAEPGLPASEDDWKLVVKRGDRGKDAEGAPTFEKRVVRVK